MKVQYISDIHLELRPGTTSFRIIRKVADILVLAGDIGKITGKPDTLTPFLDYCTNTWKHVIYVAGNHEFYDKKSSRKCIIDKIKEYTSSKDNLYFLDRDKVTIDGQRFLGCTLWSKPANRDGLNDFKYIRHSVSDTVRYPINIGTMAKWHETDRNWLYDNIQKGDVVVTHFMPLTTSDLIEAGHKSIYQPSSDDNYYGNKDCMALFKRGHGPKLWISGHTHQQFDVYFKSVRWVCNPFGYPGEQTGYMEGLYAEI